MDKINPVDQQLKLPVHPPAQTFSMLKANAQAGSLDGFMACFHPTFSANLDGQLIEKNHPEVFQPWAEGAMGKFQSWADSGQPLQLTPRTPGPGEHGLAFEIPDLLNPDSGGNLNINFMYMHHVNGDRWLVSNLSR